MPASIDAGTLQGSHQALKAGIVKDDAQHVTWRPMMTRLLKTSSAS